MDYRLLRFKEVVVITGLPKSSLYEAISRGEFPKPVKIGNRSVAWKSSEVYFWVESRPLSD